MKQLVTFFALAYFISWTIWLPLYGHALGLGSFPVLSFHHAIGAFGPLLAAVISTLIFDGNAGAKRLLAKCLALKPLLYSVVALLSPFVLAVIAMTISYLVNGVAVNWQGLLRSKEFPEYSLLTLFGYNLLFFGFGEEVGWRGFALPKIQEKLNPIVASILLTLLWALWHWPLFLYRPGYVNMDVAGIAGWISSLLTGSILLTWLYNSSKGSLLACAIFHSTIDIAFTADIADKNVVGYLGFLITIWGVVMLFFLKGKKTGRGPGKRSVALP